MSDLADEKIKNWVIGMSGSDWDSVDVERIRGTENQAKRYLMGIIKEHRQERRDEGDKFDHGTEKISDLECHGDNRFYGYLCFSDSHNDYEMFIEPEIKTIA